MSRQRSYRSSYKTPTPNVGGWITLVDHRRHWVRFVLAAEFRCSQ